MERLNAAVYYSTPSVLCVLILYIVLPERPFLLASAFGGRTSPRVRKGLSGILLIIDTLFMFSILIGLSRHCEPRLLFNKIQSEKTMYCAGFQTGVVLVFVALLFLDRITEAFFLRRTDQSLSWRCTRASFPAIAYTTLTHDFQSVMVLIGLALLARYVKLAPEVTSSLRLTVIRAIASYFGVISVDAFWSRDGKTTDASDKAYSVALIGAVVVLLRSR